MALFLFLILPSQSYALAELVEFHICSNKNVIRTLRVEVGKDNSCVTNYSKTGIDRVVGSGVHVESCKRFLNNVKGNLQGAGWSCKKATSVKMSSAK